MMTSPARCVCRQMLPSPSLGPPLLSPSWSPPLFCGMPAVLGLAGLLCDGWLAGGWEDLDPPLHAVARAMTPAARTNRSRLVIMSAYSTVLLLRCLE